MFDEMSQHLLPRLSGAACPRNSERCVMVRTPTGKYHRCKDEDEAKQWIGDHSSSPGSETSGAVDFVA
jgi:hypothetical protein